MIGSERHSEVYNERWYKIMSKDRYHCGMAAVDYKHTNVCSDDQAPQVLGTRYGFSLY